MTTRGFGAETVARADAGHRCRRRTGHGDDAALSQFGAPIPVTLLSPLVITSKGSKDQECI